MTRSIHRRSLGMRLFTVYVLFVVLVSFTGIGYAVPKGADTTPDKTAEKAARAPDSGKEAKATEESPAEVVVEPLVPDATSADDVPEVEVAPQVKEAQEPDAGAVAPAAVEPIATTAEIGSGDVNLQGVRKGTGWIKGNLHPYMEGEWVPFRLYVRNASSEPVSIPQLTVDAFHYKAGKGIYFDRTADYYYYTTPTEPAIGDPIAPQGSWSALSLGSHDVPVGGAYGVDATGLLTTITGNQVTIPPGQYAVLYFRAHLALTFYWNMQTPSRDGWGPYTGSPGNMQIYGNFGEKTVPLPAVEMPAGCVTVVKFYDTDRDGKMDDGEKLLPGWDINLVSTSGIYEWDITKTTGADGKVVFDKLPGGTFSISEDLKDGWATSTDQPVAVSLTPGQKKTVYIGNYRPDVTKRFSLTYEGSVPSGMEMLVKYKVDGSMSESMLTGSGPFTAEEVFPAGTSITDVEWYARWTPDGGAPIDILLGKTFGETLRDELTVNSFTWGSQIMGHKYEDLNADGDKADDPGLEGWRIVAERRVGDSWVEMAFRLTDADGFYKFYSLPPGMYRISERFPVDEFDWTQSAPDGGYHMITIDPIDCTVVGAACVGPSFRAVDFLNWAPASIEGYKFNDNDFDGIWDQGEMTLAGVTVYVDYDGDMVWDVDEPMDVTDASGHYFIEDITPGEYFVREVVPASWFQTTGDYEVMFLSRHHYVEGYDFGNYRKIDLSGYKWHDIDGDGTWDEGEPTLEGWEIHLEGAAADGTPVALDTATDSSGHYEFTDLPPGTYHVSEVLTGKWVQSYPMRDGMHHVTLDSGDDDVVGRNFGNWMPIDPNGYKIEDVNGNGIIDEGEPGLEGWEIHLDGLSGAGEEINLVTWTDATGHWSFPEVPPGHYVISEVNQSGWVQSFPEGDVYDTMLYSEMEPQSGFDFANWQYSGLGGVKFHDLDGDAVWDDGEPGLEGWEIVLEGYAGDGSYISRTDLTNGSGYYWFDMLPPGEYSVSETQQSGWTQSYPAPPGNHEIALESGDVIEEGPRFGNFMTVDIFGMKFHDLNANGVNDEEPGIVGWPIYLMGMTGAGVPVLMQTSTGQGGAYAFVDLMPGTYTVYEGGMDDWFQSYPESGDHELNLLSGDTLEVGLDFGNYTYASKSGVKFHDLDGDRQAREEGEPGLAGWTFYVDYDLDAQLDEDEPFGVSGEDGAYTIDGILPGTWVVREMMPEELAGEWQLTYPGMGVYIEEFESQGVYEGNDFGNTTEVPKTFELTYIGDAPAGTTFYASFDTTYTMYSPPPLPIDEDFVTAQAVAIEVASHEVTLSPVGSGMYSADFMVWPQTLLGNVKWWAEYNGERILLGMGVEEELIDGPLTNPFEYSAELFGSKWDDTNPDPTVPGNGIWDKVTEPGLPNWTIQLYRLDGEDTWQLYETTLTDAEGAYLFDGLLPGQYSVVEVIPVAAADEPQWIQSAGPLLVGQDSRALADDAEVGPIDFGNFLEPPALATFDIGIVKDVSATSTTPSGTLTYTLTYTNYLGGLTDVPITIVDDFDERYVDVVDANGGVVSGGKITWNFNVTMDPDESRTLSYTVRVKGDVANGTRIDNTVVIDMENDEDPTNNSDDASVVVGEPFLPFTGGELALLLAVLLMALAAGTALRFKGKNVP